MISLTTVCALAHFSFVIILVGFLLGTLRLVGCDGQTQVYYNQPTTPLAHLPFQRQTAQRPEVSPK